MKRIVIAVLIILAACKNETKQFPESMAKSASAADAVASRQATPVPPPPPPLQSSEIRMIIRTANVSMIVRDAADVLHRITVMVEGRGGYVADERQWRDQEQTRATVTVRVPSAQLTPVLTSLRGLAVRVDNETISGQDVSQEFTDLGSQLKNLQATEVELRELLTTVRQRTQKASQILEIFNELTRVRGEIEQAQGRMNYLSKMTTYATITVDLVPDALATPVVQPGWQPVATAKAALRSLLNTMKAVADVAIWLGLYFLPIAFLFVIAALVIRTLWRRRTLVVAGDDAA